MRAFKYQDDVRYLILDELPFVDDIRVVPLAVSALTAALIVLQALVATIQSLSGRNARRTTDCEERGFRAHVKYFGGYTIFGFMVARVLGITTLLGLSRVTLVQCGLSTCAERFLTLTYLYTVLLGVASLVSKQWNTSTTRYTYAVLLSVFGVYAYRDLWPLATYRLVPADIAEDPVLWLKIATLAFTGIFIPLFIPRKYIPVDPEHPMKETNPEQTASIISQITYSYVDPVIYEAYKSSSLTPAQLPPLRDFDAAKYQTDKAFVHLDTFMGAKRQHLFWGLMRVLRYEYTVLAILIVGYSVTSFISPIGIYQVLRYLETDGVGAEIRPWFWIVWLLGGPMLQSVIFQYELFVSKNVAVRLEGLFTQLIFNHSLRIRLKAETSSEPRDVPSESASDTAMSDTDGASVAEEGSEDGDHEGSGASTLIASHEAEASTSTTASTSLKRKGKAVEDKTTQAPDNSNENLIGKINNLITTDLGYITDGQDFLMIVIYVPLQITLCVFFLYRILGWSAIVGFAATICALPLPGWLAKKLQNIQVAKMKKTDERVQAVTEAVNVIRMIKLFGWEKKMTTQLQEKREEELKWIWKTKVYNTINSTVGYVLPTVIMLLSYAVFAVIMKGELTASTIFSSMIVFSMLREQLYRLFSGSGNVIQAKVSLDRVDDFLKNTELLDSFTANENDGPNSSSDSPHLDIGFRNAVFAWAAEAEDRHTASHGRIFKLRVDGELEFKRNALNIIIGPTGCGKTSMIMALLGEMHFMPSAPDSAFNLPRDGGIAFATQESWVLNDTIRENILFGNAYEKERYNKVIKQCAMEHDLTLFEAGDATEVGERGLTLSGGQKARITLARAIYSQAQIILLDDILAALDVHTSTWIVNNCLLGDLVKGRTVILVTHNVALVGPVADFIVSIGSNGTVKSQTQDLSIALARDPKLAAEVRRDEEVLKAGQDEVAPAAEQGKLVVSEEVARGHVSWKAIKLFVEGLGGSHPIRFIIIVTTALILNEWSFTFQVWYIGHWGSQYEKHPASEVKAVKYLTTYSALLLGSFVIQILAYVYFQWGALRASRTINKRLVDSVFGSTLRWLDETPTGRIIARCTQDIRAIDGPVPQTVVWLFDLSGAMLTKLGAIALLTPAFLVPGMISALIGLYVANLYLKAQLSVKREMSNARSPLLSHFSSAIDGLVSIRAYGAQNKFINESMNRVDHYTRMARMSCNISRWISIRIDLLGATFTAALASYLIYGPKVGAANTGFSLNMAVEFTNAILHTVGIFNMFEVQANSLERIRDYLDIDHEPKPTQRGIPPAAWPTSGDLRVKNLSARYSQTGPNVLHDISFDVTSGERVGVVGRTGSGKSSLTLSLLRCILTEGEIYFDGLPISGVNLDALRSNITIIPQIPELLSGTLRQNLDPFGQHDDSVMNDALRSAGLFTLQEEEGEANLSLDSQIAGGGTNLSVGQRQIIAIARAMIRDSKLFILDEATSAIDHKTDIIIQNALRSQLGKDVTVITIAHRLQTVMDADRILVLDSGRIAEYGAPKDLLKNDKGAFRALVEGSGDKDVLYKLAGI